MRARRVVTAVLGGALCASATLAGGAPAATGAADPPPLDVRVVQAGLQHPWALTFLPDGSMLYTQRDRLSVTLRDPQGRSTVVLSRPAGMWSGGETGLMGIEKSADFARSGVFYTCHGYRSGDVRDVRVVAWRLDRSAGRATFVRNVVVGLPSSTGRHGGCALRRGKADSLFIGTGDAARGGIPQSLTSGGGKVLRVSATTGRGYDDNPWASARTAMQRRVWTYGHRNVQGVVRQPSTGQMWSVEQGSYRDDEVNVLVKGGNYGWNPVPRASGDPDYNEGANSPMTDDSLPGTQRQAAWRSGTSTVATSGADFVSGSGWGSLDGALAVATLKGTSLRLLTFDSSRRLVRQYTPSELSGTYGRLRGVQRGPGGVLYVTTSNGTDDKILRVAPRG